MRRNLLRAVVAVLLLTGLGLFVRSDNIAHAQELYKFDLGAWANDAAALTYVQANRWDTAGDGTGNPQNGMSYYNTTADITRVWDGAAWDDSDENTTHVLGSGADHADVALNNAARHVQGTDLGLDTGGVNPVTAAQLLPLVERDPDNGKMGFENLTDSTMAFVDGTLTLTITDAGAGYTVCVLGVCNDFVGNDTAVITDTQGEWFFWYDGTFTLVASQVEWDLTAVAAVATVYWDATANDSYDSFAEDRHSNIMSWETHRWGHDIFGAQLDGGLALTYTPGLGAADLDAQVAISSGEIHDEDLEIDIVAAAVPAANYEQILAIPAEIPVWYLEGAAANNRWLKAPATTFPMRRFGGAARLAWNENNAGTWQQTEVQNNRWTTVYICYAPRYVEPVFAIQGQSDFATEALADEETVGDLVLTGFPVQEIVTAYKLVLRTSNGYGNTVQARIDSATFIRQNAPGGNVPAATQHNSLTARDATNTHPVGSIDRYEVVLYDVSEGSSVAYATVTLALAASGDGDTVVVPPGIYAENVTIPDGAEVECWGDAVIGTGAGPAVTVASPGVGEIAYITGTCAITATAAIAVTAGAIVHVDSTASLNGTKDGPWRVGDTNYLEAGDAIATYIPADGSLAAVAVGDWLEDGNTGVAVQAMSHGGTTRWLGDVHPIRLFDTGAVSATTGQWMAYHPESYTQALFTSLDGHYLQTQADSANNYFVTTVDLLGVTLVTVSTQNESVDIWEIVRTAVDTVLDYPSLTGEADTNGDDGFKVTATETGNQTSRWQLVANVREIAQ